MLKIEYCEISPVDFTRGNLNPVSFEKKKLKNQNYCNSKVEKLASYRISDFISLVSCHF